MAGPLEQFEVKTLHPIEVMGYDVSFTNSSMWMLIVAGVSILLLVASTMNRSIVPGRLQSVGEVLYEFLANMLIDIAGTEARRYFPYIFSLFLFIFFANLLGLLPYSFTVTSHLSATFALAFVGFFLCIVVGFARHGIKFLGFFMPTGAPWILGFLLVPIELFTYFIRPFTLAIRLGANMLAGHIVLKIFAGFSVGLATTYGIGAGVPVALINVLMIGFEVFVAGLQAYIFTLLMCTYLNDSVHLH